MEDRIGRELRRNQLATRMVSHKAHTQTICDYTGLARERIKTLRRDWPVASGKWWPAHHRISAENADFYWVNADSKITVTPKVTPALAAGERASRGV
jgi:hypothetical protein